MPFNSNIYRVNWVQEARKLVPLPLRTTLVPVVNAAIAPLVFVYNAFLIFKAATEYRLLITPQVCYLEKALNDRYDPTLRRIYITDAVEYLPKVLYLKSENKPVVLSLKSENKPVVMYTRGETSQYTDDFVIHIPLTISFSTPQLRAFVDGYKLLSKTYHIQLF